MALKVLPTTIERSPPSCIFSALDSTPKNHDRSSKGIFPSAITFTRLVRALRKVTLVCPFDSQIFQILGETPSKRALEPLEKNMTHDSIVDENFEVEKQPISVVRNIDNFPLPKFQLEGRVVVDHQSCNLVVAYCHSVLNVFSSVIYTNGKLVFAVISKNWVAIIFLIIFNFFMF